VLALFDHRAAAKYIRLAMELPEDATAVHTDRRALEQILTNLVDNAVKYCPEGATVTVRARTRDSAVQIAVEDSGPGIEGKHLPRLFERFYRVDAGRSRDVGGTGLGLSIVRHLAEAVGDGIRVHSAVGRGTTFTFTVPHA
jgi:two-component system, OmpR family, phosphate regulon sensor histidine kinase PhoR